MDLFGHGEVACDSGYEKGAFGEVSGVRFEELALEELVCLLGREIHIVGVVTGKVWDRIGNKSREGELLPWSCHFVEGGSKWSFS